MLTCTNTPYPRWKPWVVGVLVLILIVISITRIPANFIDVLAVFLIVTLIGACVGLFLYLGQPDRAEAN